MVTCGSTGYLSGDGDVSGNADSAPSQLGMERWSRGAGEGDGRGGHSSGSRMSAPEAEGLLLTSATDAPDDVAGRGDLVALVFQRSGCERLG